ncbi:MAG: chemotaxis protein CheX [Planctomycetes bacterium]|nr:chemotaxis protein CheX [Planctomycetota bacterium]
MDARYINAFINSVCNTFGKMCGLEVTVGKPELKTANEPLSDVSSVIGFSGGATGSVVLHFRYDVASKMASAFAGTEITPDHEDFADALGELANMVAGGAKSAFEGFNISISLPNVIVGANHSVFGTSLTQRLLIPCATELGQFHVEVGMVMGKAGAGAPPQQTRIGART